MNINNWQINYEGTNVITVSFVSKIHKFPYIADTRIYIRSKYVLVKHKGCNFKLDSDYAHLPRLFAESLSGILESENKIKKELTWIKKLYILLNIEDVI